MPRLFILDPVCAQVLGHNLTSLIKFRSYFSSFGRYKKITCVASCLLPKSVARNHEIEQAFGFYYLNRINILDEDGNAVADASVKLSDYEELQQEAAELDMRKFFEHYEIGNADSLFFPSVDFCSCIALFQNLRNSLPQKAPNIFLRFIGVMEYANSMLADPRRELVRQLRDLIGLGYPIHVSAESAVYADKLSELIGSPVAATPVPPDHELLPMNENGDFQVISPGSGRVDKGFNILPEIIAEYRQRHPHSKVKFIIQNLPMWDLVHNMRFASQIYSAPGVELLPASISFEDMSNMFQQSHVVLMPYAPDIYALRSSAILTEAVGYGRQILTSKGTGFEMEVSYFGIGQVCETVSDYVAAIFKLSQSSRRTLNNRAIQARYRYSLYCLAQYKGWLL